MKITLSYKQQCYNFWALANLIRRGYFDKDSQSQKMLSGPVIISRVDYYVETYEFDEKVSLKLSEQGNLVKIR